MEKRNTKQKTKVHTQSARSASPHKEDNSLKRRTSSWKFLIDQDRCKKAFAKPKLDRPPIEQSTILKATPTTTDLNAEPITVEPSKDADMS